MFNQRDTDFCGIKRACTIGGESVYRKSDVSQKCADLINADNYFKGRVRVMSKDLDSAGEILDKAMVQYSEKLDNFMELESRMSDATKKATGRLKDATQKLGDGVARVEKQANFERLGKYVELLERAESAITALANLEQSGKLDKIAKALK